MNITKADVFWNYAATFLKIASSALLIPFLLRVMPSETVGIWSVFVTITAFSSLLDFGFSSSFTRNVTYVFSGVKSLRTSGIEKIHSDINEEVTVDYGLLKGLILAMRWFYFRTATVLFLILISFGTYYIYTLTKKYHGHTSEVYISWFILCLVNSYNLYTLYYEALLLGKGLIKKSKQIIILGQLAYLVFAVGLIMNGFGLIAIVLAQTISVLIIRILSYNSFFTTNIKNCLSNVHPIDRNIIIKAISPNAIKIGLTSFGGFLVQKSSIIIGSLFLPLEEIASYGITIQIIAVISSLAAVYSMTFLPKMAYLRTIESDFEIKYLYLKGQLLILVIYIFCGFFLLFFGKKAFDYIGSSTELMSPMLIAVAFFLSYVEAVIGSSGSVLLTKNEVPFFKAALISGFGILLGLIFSFKFFTPNLWILILVPLAVDLSYQAWKWPLEVVKEFRIKRKDVHHSLINILNKN
jgi:O-antigen/teichoic acid export membrane protein